MLRDTVTTFLDALGLLLVAAGAGLVVLGLVELAGSAHGMTAIAHGAGVTSSGAVVLAGSWLAARQARPRADRTPG